MGAETAGKFTTAERLEQYKAYLQDVGNIGSRHETARGFYLSVLSALLAFLELTGDKGPFKAVGAPVAIMVALGGSAIAVLWLLHTLSFNALYDAKFRLLGRMEEQLPFQIFDPEYALLQRNWKYIKLTYVECAVALVFLGLFMAALRLGGAV